MSLMPRSLLGRNVLLIVVLMTLAQLVSAVLVRELILRPRLDQISESLARNVTAIRAGLGALPVAQRQAFVDEFNRRGLQGTPGAAPRGPLKMRLTPLERRFVRAISEHVVPQGMDLVWRREAEGSLALRLAVDSESYWLVLPGVLPAREFTGTWIAASLAAVVLAIIGAFAIQRRINGPLARVVRATGELARAAPPSPLPEDGPLETASLARSFNQLVASLARSDHERALMLAGVSHDLRTPLTKLRLGVEILSARAEPELIASMTRSVDEMDGIVGQFLDFARSDAPGAPSEPAVRCAIDELVRGVVAAAADHGRHIATTLANPPIVLLRENAMRRALDNLVENAFKHGEPPVSISTGADASTVWIDVIDHGSGISADESESLKQPFRRAHSARTGAPGAGLGLAIVDRIVRAQGGSLHLLPSEPQGLRARISLPRG